MKQKTTQENVVRYYTRPGSRIGYNLVMKGSKHFGYYDEIHTTEPTAQLRFLEKISELLRLESGMGVLDAGCGQGVVACYLAGKHDAQITGLTLVPFEVVSAEKRARREGVAGKTRFMVGDYADPPFPHGSFDRIYAVETLSHAPDVALVISQFMKLLKPGGRLVCIEYELDLKKIGDKEPGIIDFFTRYGALHGLRQFGHGQFLTTLNKAGFSQVTEHDWTEHVLPSFRRLRRIARPAAPIVKALNLHRFAVNTIAAAKYADWTEQGLFSFKAYSAVKPGKHR